MNANTLAFIKAGTYIMEENLRRMHEKKRKQIEAEYNQARLFIHAVPELLEAQSKRNVVKTNSQIVSDNNGYTLFLNYLDSEIAGATDIHHAKMASIKERLANNTITREELEAELNSLHVLPEGMSFVFTSEPPIP